MGFFRGEFFRGRVFLEPKQYICSDRSEFFWLVLNLKVSGVLYLAKMWTFRRVKCFKNPVRLIAHTFFQRLSYYFPLDRYFTGPRLIAHSLQNDNSCEFLPWQRHSVASFLCYFRFSVTYKIFIFDLKLNLSLTTFIDSYFCLMPSNLTELKSTPIAKKGFCFLMIVLFGSSDWHTNLTQLCLLATVAWKRRNNGLLYTSITTLIKHQRS